jgi:hypothetical protein
MESSLWDQLSPLLWDDVDEESTFPAKRPLLAHYTSMAALKAIVESGEVWFSNPLYMNDWEELVFGMTEGRNIFRENEEIRAACKTPAAHEKLVGYLDALLGDFDRNHVLDTYVFCLSEHPPDLVDGLLSMWRGYGDSGNGVAIVFNSAVIEENKDSPFVVAKVRYASVEQRRAWLKEKATLVGNTIRGMDLDDDALLEVADLWIERTKQFALFCKHDGFADEREWRVVYLSERDRRGNFRSMIGVALTANGLEPKLRLAVHQGPLLGSLSLDGVVERIILGPTVSEVMAERTTKRMLQLAGREALVERVAVSTIPLRRRGGQ